MDITIRCKICKQDLEIDWVKIVSGTKKKYTIYVNCCEEGC